MIIDSHEHVMLPSDIQIRKLDEAHVDKAVLFTTTPHVERARSSTLSDIEAEMQVLYRILGGSFTIQERMDQMKATITELKEAIAVAPDRFYGFGPVPLGLSDKNTSEWVEKNVVDNSFKGIGEFTPGSEAQVEQLEPVFRASEEHGRLPLWVHTFDPVTPRGITILMDLVEKYPTVPVIFGHGGGYNWMGVLAFARDHPNAYFDLSAAFAPISVRTALTEIPKKCLFSSDAPFGEPVLSRQLVEYVSPSDEVTAMALGENAERLLRI